MEPKPDKECGKRDDIVLLSEIIANFIYWQGILNQGWHLKLLRCGDFCSIIES